MIKNVIFDLGRVMYNYWPREHLQNLGYNEEQVNSLMECIFDSPLWQDMDKGLYNLKTGADKMCADFPHYEEDIRRILADGWIDNVITLMPSSVEFFNEVKAQGYKTYVLSNFSEDGFAHIRKRDAFLFDQMDGIVVSAHEKLNKPDPAIYECLRKRYRLAHEECIFIDDLPKNIMTALDLGIHGIIFEDVESCRKYFTSRVAMLERLHRLKFPGPEGLIII